MVSLTDILTSNKINVIVHDRQSVKTNLERLKCPISGIKLEKFIDAQQYYQQYIDWSKENATIKQIEENCKLDITDKSLSKFGDLVSSA